jgi:hypothetical protein
MRKKRWVIQIKIPRWGYNQETRTLENLPIKWIYFYSSTCKLKALSRLQEERQYGVPSSEIRLQGHP